MSNPLIVSKEKLSFLQQKLFTTYRKKPVMNNLRAMIVPHAGLKYSGHIANEGYTCIPWEKYNRILLLSTHHNHGTFIPQSNEFRLKEKLYQFNHQGLEEYIPQNNFVFENEHSWIVQLPFLQKENNLTIILVNEYSELMFQSILKIIDKDTLVIANTDLLHCGPSYMSSCPKDIRRSNEKIIGKIVRGEMLASNELCGKRVIELFRRIVSVKNWDYHSHYYTSSDVVSSATSSGNSVGYTTILYTELPIKELVKIPRKIMESQEVQSLLGQMIEPTRLNRILKNLAKIYPKMNQIYDYTYGIFVTIENNKKLRGCIGTFSQTRQLFRSIADMTLKSAFFDSRFYDDMIEKQELPQLDYKVNFISKPFVIFQTDQNYHDHNLYTIVKPVLQIGLHGISLYFADGKSSTYLANVLIESFGIVELNLQNWKRLSDSLVKKAGSSYETITKIELYECREYDEFGRRIQ